MMHHKSTFPGVVVKGPAKLVAPLNAAQTVAKRAVSALLLILIQLYRWIFSPAQIFLFGADSGCRFTPTCSQYAAEAIRYHGAVAGGILAFKRICRCHPLGGCGFDPVPRGNDGGQYRKEKCG